MSPQPQLTPLYFDAQISQFDGILPAPLSAPIVSEVIDFIRADQALKTDVEEARKHLKRELIDDARTPEGKLLTPEYDAIKKQLPGVTWTGTFNKRTNAGLIQHSGFLSFDIDFIDKHTAVAQRYDVLQDQARQAFKVLRRDPFTSFLFQSVSETGVKGLVEIPVVSSDAEYKSYFRAYKAYAEATLYQSLDSLPDISRLCFLTHCQKPFVNQNATIFDRRVNDGDPLPDKQDAPSDVSVKAAVAVLLRHGIPKNLGRNDFVGVCGAFKRGGIEYDTFDRVMKKTPGYNAPNNFKIWNTVNIEAPCASPKTAATLIQWARELDKEMFRAVRKELKATADAPESADDKGMATAIENKLATRYSFDLNLVNDKISVITPEETRPISDYIESEIRCWLLDQGFAKRDAIADVIRVASYKNRFHPIENYLRGLTWDGVDHFEKIGRYFHDKDKIFPHVFQAWCVAAIRRTLTGQHHQVLIFVGKQGKGKSYFIKWMCPLPGYHIESAINPESNDSKIRLSENWIWEIGEIGSTTRRADIEALKLFISLETAVFRRSHDKYDQHKRPLASFLGTVNPDGAGFLNDPTGHRRWWPVELTQIDFAYVQALDVNQIWAQAMQMFKESPGYCAISDSIQETINANIESDFMVSDPVEDLAQRIFDFTGLVSDFMDTTDILCTMARNGYQRGHQHADAMYVAKAMKHLTEQGAKVWKGREHGTRGTRGYFGIRPKNS